MKLFRISFTLIVAALAAPLLLDGCGGNAMDSFINPPPVSAQQNYSTASLNGTYTYNQSGIDENGQPFDGLGVVQLDGHGNMTGTFTNYYPGGLSCTYELAAAYTLSSSASGLAHYNATTNSPGCEERFGTVAIHAAQQGQSFAFAESDGKRLSSGIALKQ